MADRRRPDRSRRAGVRLAGALRREARAERPEFSPTLQHRVVAAVAAERGARVAPVTPPVTGRRSMLLGGLATTAFGVMIAVALLAPRAAMPPVGGVADVGVSEPLQGIERLPTPGEIGAGVLAEVTTIAAMAVGVPEWSDLAGFDPAPFTGADDAGR